VRCAWQSPHIKMAPLLSSPSAGAFTVDFRNALSGIVGNAPPVTGAIFGLGYVRQIGSSCNQICQAVLRYVVVTADTGGAAWTTDEGTTWYVLPGVTGCWAVSFSSPDAGWLVGMGGTILKISF